MFTNTDLELPIPIELRGDNINANALANGTSMNNRTRHIDIRQRFVTEKASEGLIKVVWVSTDIQTADIFTKPLPQEIFLRHAKSLSLQFQDHQCLLCFCTFASNNALHRHIRGNHAQGIS